MRRRLCLALIWLSLALSCAGLQAHDLHQSTGELEWNGKTQKLEVSLTIFINDLELALIRQFENLLYLEKTPAGEFDAAVLAYLTTTFIVTDAEGAPAKLEWVGRKLEPESTKSGDPALVLYFQVPLPRGPKGMHVKNTILHELFEDQINLLHCQNGALNEQLIFKKGDGKKVIPNAKN